MPVSSTSDATSKAAGLHAGKMFGLESNIDDVVMSRAFFSGSASLTSMFDDVVFGAHSETATSVFGVRSKSVVSELGRHNLRILSPLD